MQVAGERREASGPGKPKRQGLGPHLKSQRALPQTAPRSTQQSTPGGRQKVPEFLAGRLQITVSRFQANGKAPHRKLEACARAAPRLEAIAEQGLKGELLFSSPTSCLRAPLLFCPACRQPTPPRPFYGERVKQVLSAFREISHLTASATCAPSCCPPASFVKGEKDPFADFSFKKISREKGSIPFRGAW